VFQILHKHGSLILIFSSNFIIASAIIIYFYMYLKQFRENAIYHDPLNRQCCRMPYFNFAISYWPITHTFFYFCETMIFIDIHGNFTYDVVYLCLFGVLWEVIEFLLKMFFASGTNQRCKRVRIPNGEIEYCNSYWESSYKDILFNSLGIFFGLAIKIYILQEGLQDSKN